MKLVSIASIVLLFLIAFLLSCADRRVSEVAYPQLAHRYAKAPTRGTEVSYLLVFRREGVLPKLIILFPGGKGTCHFGDIYSRESCGKGESNSVEVFPGVWVSYNFVARNVREFALRGHVVVLVDMPDDVKARLSLSGEPKEVASAYRVGGDWDGEREPHDVVRDITSVINSVQGELLTELKEVYLLGTSRGTLASAYLSGNLPVGIEGAVLTSTVAGDPKFSSYCPDTAEGFISCTGINSFTGRVLLVHHRKDGCRSSPYKKAFNLFRVLPQAQKTFVTVNGGFEVSSNPCKARTHHGFYGKDKEVVKLILDWIEGKPVPEDI
jgi:pimeloyl-ACP methyl ester carboxylesterase